MTNKCSQCKGRKLDKIWCPKCGNNKPLPLSGKSFKAEDIFKGIYPNDIELLEVKDVKQAIQGALELLKRRINFGDDPISYIEIVEIFKEKFGDLAK